MKCKSGREPFSVDWERVYNGFTANITDFDCGRLCAPANGGVPACCVNETHQPVLFREELRWLRTKTALWRKRRACTPRHKKMDAEIEEYICYADCRGIAHCRRRFRSLTCRFFPFEPYFDERGEFVGLTWMYRAREGCALIGTSPRRINPRYIEQSLAVWKALFEAFPGEVECYVDVSRKLRRQYLRSGDPITIFPPPRRGRPVTQKGSPASR